METTVQTAEAKHIFVDIVGYTHSRSVEAQSDLISTLNRIVNEALRQQQVPHESVIFIPTGDGMCISLINLFSPYDIHLKLGLSILELLESHNKDEKDEMRQFQLRIGINENIDNLIIDINGNKNISGSGINFAARIEGLGDKQQI